MKLFEMLFVSSVWRIAIRKNPWQWPFCYNEPFIEMKGDTGYWYADPMLFQVNSDYYVFCEAFNKKKQIGEIAVLTYDGNHWSKPQIIISNNYHMSYPCVFVVGNDFFMTPESQESNRLEIYKAVDFPYKWIKVKNLLENVKIADPTMWKDGKEFYLSGYTGKNPYQFVTYRYDPQEMTLTLKNTIKYFDNVGRPAGYLIPNGDSFLRPTQDCRESYGRSLLWNELQIKKNEVTEYNLSEIDNRLIKVGNKIGVDRIHTFTRSGDYEVIDYCINRFDIFKRFRIFYRQFKRNQRNNKPKHN